MGVTEGDDGECLFFIYVLAGRDHTGYWSFEKCTSVTGIIGFL